MRFVSAAIEAGAELNVADFLNGDLMRRKNFFIPRL
jgi:hypothetical protein